jgi:apolipoprotein N-acyltransferase
VFLAAGVIFGSEAKLYSNSVESDQVFNHWKADRGVLYERLQWTSYGVGAGLAIVGAVLYWMGVSSSGSAGSVAALVVPGGVALSAGGAF